MYEQVINTSNQEVEHKQYIHADGKFIAINIRKEDVDKKQADYQNRYLHCDALESVDLITDGYGNIVERRSFDPWGKARELNWRSDVLKELKQFTLTNRGYTGHEHIEEVGTL